MPQRYVFSRCSLELADGWTAEPRAEVTAGERCEFLAISPEANDALLRLTPDERGLIAAVDWVDLVGRINRAKKRPVSAARCGDFVGIAVEFKSGEDWIRGWALSAEGFPLDVNYRCKIGDAGRDDLLVHRMLHTLRLEKR
jgi:hypothetical protein